MLGLAGLLAGETHRMFVPSSQSVKEEYLDVEYDTVERSATISVYSRAVEGLASVESSSSGTGSAHHWVLLVQFEDDSFRLLEGNQNDDGFLHAYYSKRKAQGMSKLKDLGEVLISPSKLRSIARDNRLNGTRYDLVSNNCQDWAVRAAKDISPDIGKEATKIERISPALSLTRDVVTGALFTTNPLLYVMTRRN